MILPLVCTAMHEPGYTTRAEISDAEGTVVCLCGGLNALSDARELVNAVNERVALKERIAHLEELIKRWR